MALGPDGSLYLADGTAGRLLRFRAVAPPTLTPAAFTNESPLNVPGTTAPNARVDVFVNDGPTPVTVVADGAGAFSVPLALSLNAENTLDGYACAWGPKGRSVRGGAGSG